MYLSITLPCNFMKEKLHVHQRWKDAVKKLGKLISTLWKCFDRPVVGLLYPWSHTLRGTYTNVRPSLFNQWQDWHHTFRQKRRAWNGQIFFTDHLSLSSLVFTSFLLFNIQQQTDRWIYIHIVAIFTINSIQQFKQLWLYQWYKTTSLQPYTVHGLRPASSKLGWTAMNRSKS